MKILHCCLSCFYIDNYNYQENVLPLINKNHGHDVKIIASTETFIENSKLGYVNAGKYINRDGISVERVAYKRWLPHFIMKKIRIYKNVYDLIEKFSPDIILFHGVCAYELLTIVKYKKNNPKVKVYIDSHSDFNNSSQNLISREILHKRFYKRIVDKALPWIDKILCISIEAIDFLEQLYKVPKDKMELYPLGGIIFTDFQWKEKRDKIRKALSVDEDDILVIHSGKMDVKKCTIELLKSFTQVENSNLKLVLIGSFTQEIESTVNSIINLDKRIKYIGWKDSSMLLGYLCGADIYVQPGSQSATMQNAICCRCPIAVYPHKSHKPYLKENGFYVKNINDMVQMFYKIGYNPEILKNMSKESYNIACELLDYNKLASRLYI